MRTFLIYVLLSYRDDMQNLGSLSLAGHAFFEERRFQEEPGLCGNANEENSVWGSNSNERQ